ncbi:MAG: DUF916 domain-containing protein [Candidatus Gracilibacteria bacterium]|nr:DUF916 domain-containing protein [Candidatus Gracilibacteria bacterium]MDD2908512.1 DUF916 domain-containing protein [Candidatus Gracilibacteria bacterium]
MNFKKISFFIVSFLMTLQFANANLSISPLKHEFNVNPGETKSELIRVTNNDNSPITLYTSKEDFIAGDETGTPSFIKPKDKKNDEFSLSNWIKLENETITLAKGETREVRFTVNVPANGEPGGHYGAIFFSPGAPSGAQVAVVQRLGVLVLINVSGDLKIEGNLTDFAVGAIKDKKFESASTFGNFPITFQTKFSNDGNVHIKPTGKIVLTDENGNELKNVGKESLVNPNGAFIGEKLVDYIPVNDSLGNVLPKSIRKFESIWEGFGYQELKEDGTKIVKFKNISDFYKDKKVENKEYLNFWETVKTRKTDKKITAKLELNYEGKDKIKKTFTDSKVITVSFDETYVGISLWIIGAIIIVLLAGIYYFIVLKPQLSEKLKARLREEIRNQK